MTKKLSILLLLFFSMFGCAGYAIACNIDISCKDIETIYVSKGTQQLSEGKSKTVFVTCVDLEPARISLETLLDDCQEESIIVRSGEQTFELTKDDFSPYGNWFCIICETPAEALDAAKAICPDKVINHLPTSDATQ